MSACRLCGGTEALMDVAMAPGMTYCRPCRIKRAADAARQREWEWDNPICPVCEGQHPPDECPERQCKCGGAGPILTCPVHWQAAL